MTLTTAQLDRACGVLLGTAAGDALGAAYEFGPPRGPKLEVAMVGGGSFGWEPGEWTDDTSMAIAIAEVAATGADLREEEALDALTRGWHEWSQHAKDVGVQTRSVLSQAGRHGRAERDTVRLNPDTAPQAWRRPPFAIWSCKNWIVAFSNASCAKSPIASAVGGAVSLYA